MWPTVDGMVEGHFKVTPEVGGRIKACIEDGTRRKFREARCRWGARVPGRVRGGCVRRRSAGDPTDAKSGGYTTHILIDHEALVRGNTSRRDL